jgi:hypothetical protein
MSDARRVLTRRDFVRGTVGAVVGGSVLGVEPLGAAVRATRPARSARVVLVRDQRALNASHDVDVTVLREMLSETITRLTGQPSARAAWQAIFKPSDVVGLVATDHLNPTHGEVVEAVRAQLIDAGMSADRIRNAQGGLDRARPCTALIALPALKAHWLTGMGTVLKLYILYSGRPSRYHGENNVNLGEIWNLPDVRGKTRLVLVDALRPLCDKGPQPDPRYLWDYKGLIAGTDPVAVEAIGLKIIMAKRQALRGEPWPLSPPPLSVAAADERFGLGTSRLGEIKVETYGWTQDALV